MDGAAALFAVRGLMVVAVVVVLGRALRGTRRARELAPTAWQYVWLLYLADYALMWWHPLRPETPSWYDGIAVPLGLGLMAAGILLVLWAYATMGEEWSGDIAVGSDHRVVAEGPFAFVRHPVYAGFLLGVLGGAMALADPLVLVAAVVSVPLMRKRAAAEERFLEERLGDAYRNYRRRVGMFVPKVR